MADGAANEFVTRHYQRLRRSGDCQGRIRISATERLGSVILFLLISPVIGFRLGYCFIVVTISLSHSRERHKAERTFRHLQLLSAGAYSLGHGTNDAQRPWELSLRCWWQAERKNGR
jgi:hypothetical protein